MGDERRVRREIDREELFECIQRHPGWTAAELAEHLGYESSDGVRRFIRRYMNRGVLREVVEVLPGEMRPLGHPFLVGIVTDQEIYRRAGPDDYPIGADYRDQDELAAWLLKHLGTRDFLVHDAMMVLGAPFDILLCVSSRGGIPDLAPVVTTTLRRYRGVRATLTMPVGAWHRT